MFSGRLSWAMAILATGWGVLFSCATPAARAGFQIVRDSVSPDPAGRRTTFSVTFNQPPDFFHADADGNPRNAFQYFYGSDPADFDFMGSSVVIIRGPEIRFDGDIPVRDSLNNSGIDFPHAEGWGRERGAVSFDLDKTTVTFSVPWKMLGETDEKFTYRLFALDGGALTTDIERTFIPLPSPGRAGLLAIVGMIGSLLVRQRRVTA